MHLETFTVAHNLRCLNGGYTHIRQNVMQESFAKLLSEILKEVKRGLKNFFMGKLLQNRTATNDDTGLKANNFLLIHASVN